MVFSKKILILLAVVTASALCMASTYAWRQMVSKTNEFIGKNTDVTLHDDFDVSTGAKDVYVENTGSGEVFVRVRLDEAMDLTSSNKPDDSQWQPHVIGATAEDCGHANPDGELFHDYFTWTLGGQKYYLPADGTSQVVQDIADESANPDAKQTPYIDPSTQIVSAAAYLAMDAADQASFIGWIWDTDGYAYWSQPLEKGEVTGLLLHKVTTDPSLSGTNYYYGIDVVAEAVDINDIPMWVSGAASVDGSGTTYQVATDDGKAVIEAIVSFSAATP